MDSGEGGGEEIGGGEERDADPSTMALTCPLPTPAAIPEQGSSSRTSGMAPAKEPRTLPQQEEGTEGFKASKERERHLQENSSCPKKVERESYEEGLLSFERKKEGVNVGRINATDTGDVPGALNSKNEEKEKEEGVAISNQSQTKSKISLLPQQSQYSSSSSIAKESGTLNSKISTSTKPSPTTSTSPKHFNSPSSFSALSSITEVKDIKGDSDWISGFPQSFKSQQSTLAFPHADTEPACKPAEDDGLAGVSSTSIFSGCGPKALEPNVSKLDPDMEEDGDKDEEQNKAVLKNHNQDLPPNSMTSHLTIMHSRNSCKTLKCPKCNWHYKSQHTLQVHMKEKHPETDSKCVCGALRGKCVCGGATRSVCAYCSSGKPHPRLARGETYVCGYKPYRCEVCDYATSSKGNLSIHMQSDKHLNNVQNGGHSNGNVHTSQVTTSSSSSSHSTEDPTYKIPLSNPSNTTLSSKLTPPAHSNSNGKRWRCDVCAYETSIARNLRIHTTSEKHTHNLLRLQRGYYLSHSKSLQSQLEQLQNTGAELSLNVRLTGQQVAEQPVMLGSALTPSPSPSPPPAPSVSPKATFSQGMFQCLICTLFSSSSLKIMEQHLTTPRSLPQSEWCSLVAGGCHCRLCGYTTTLRANFSLHCQTDRHRTRYQLIAHLKEGGDRGQEGAAIIAKGNPVQVRCNLCDYVTSSLEKLQGHSLSSHHNASARVYRFLQQYDGDFDDNSWVFSCLLCNHSCSSKLQVLKHSQTATHQQREELLQLQPKDGEELEAIFTIKKAPDAIREEVGFDNNSSSNTSFGLLETTKDTIDQGEENVSEENGETREENQQMRGSVEYLSPECSIMEDSNKTKRPRIHQQKENQQSIQCPLCQVELPNTHLRLHLIHVHSVAQDCVDKIISTVRVSINLLSQQGEELPTGLCTDDIRHNKPTENKTSDSSDASDSFASGTSVENTATDLTPPKDVTALLTPPCDDGTCDPSKGRPAPQSPSQIQPSLPHTSPPCDPPTLSERHGYRYRCSRCSLAFPTQEKLHLHWQYHAMRAATECPLCSRQCRSQEALQRHMQNTHSQVKYTLQLRQKGPCVDNNKTSMPEDFSSSTQESEETIKDEDEDMEEEASFIYDLEGQNGDVTMEENMLTKSSEDEAELTKPEKVSLEEISEQISSSPIKKGYNPTIDRYLDPSRPYKCTICSESFTQKTILLVHFNSVSHIHRARRALQESGTSFADPEATHGSDPRPYRCKLCGVGYSQSSTLDIHLRSVLHQTRIRGAQNTSAQAPASVDTAQESTSTQQVEGAMSNSLPPIKRADELPTEIQKKLKDLIESQQTEKNIVDLLAVQNHQILLQQQQLVQVQAQAQAQFQQNTSILQPQPIQHLPLMPENLLKQHFSLAPDSLFSLQENLMLPFYLSGEMKLDVGQETYRLLLPKTKNDQAEDKTGCLLKEDKKHIQNGSDLVVGQGNDHLQSQPKGNAVSKGFSINQLEKENHKTSLMDEREKHKHPDSSVNSYNRIQNDESDPSSFNPLGKLCPPPRVPYASVNGEPLRALLQSYGYELAMQYVQSKHQHQQQMATQVATDEQESSDSNIKQGSVLDRDEPSKPLENTTQPSKHKNNIPTKNSQSSEEGVADREKMCCVGEKCDDCGKLFSDVLLLKSHQEYIHRIVFPAAELEMFSKQYRLQYDLVHQIIPNKSCENFTSPQKEVPITTTLSEPEVIEEHVKTQVKPKSPSPVQPVLDTTTKISDTITDEASNAPAVLSCQNPSNPELTKDAPLLGTSASTTPQTKATTKTITPCLPKIPVVSLPLLPIAPLPLSKLPLPPIPFSMELPLIPPVVMHSMALQPQPWLDSNVGPEITKLYQSQLKPPLLGQTPQLSPDLLGHPPLPSPVQVGQQTQAGATVVDQQQGKRTRTRISDEQLTVLKRHFDINSLPSDEDINKISALSALPYKVIKHWFRNTLFKERQRDKDSPYNFNNPPTISLEESSGGISQNHALSLSPCSLSPGIQASNSPHDLTTELQRGEPHRGQRSSRTRFTEQQLETLQRIFEATPYPREEEYDQMSAQLSLPNRVIVVWFQNARQRARKNQDRMVDIDVKGKTSLDTFHSKKNDCDKSDNIYKDRGCVDEKPDDYLNENSMDLSYEYYTQPESPASDSPSHCAEGKHLPERAKKLEEAIISSSASESHICLEPPPVPKSEQLLQQEISSQSCSFSTSENIEPISHSSPKPLNVSSSDDILEMSSNLSPDMSSTQESKPSNTSLTDSTNIMSTKTQPLQLPASQYQCNICNTSLTTLQLWQEHQARHILAAQSQVQLLHSGFTEQTLPYMMLHSNHTIMASQILSGAMSQIPFTTTHPVISHLNNLQMKSTLSEHTSNTLSGLSQNSVEPVNHRESSFECQRGRRDVEDEHRKDKRQRTTITPEQLEVLYHRYSLDSNPTRGVLESIARDIGLTRRVVQVWFQNTRARERKGQFRSLGPGSSFSLGLNHLRCPFCRAQFKVKSALDAHMRSRHRAEAEKAGCILSTSKVSSEQISLLMPYATDKPAVSISGKSAHSICVTTNPKSPVNTSMTALYLSTPLSKAEEEEEYKEIDEDYTFEDSFSMADQEAFSPENSVGSSSEWTETQTQQHEQQHDHHHQQQQRQRTQMSHFQVLQLRDFYRTHRTPNRHECEALGQELGLPQRVVQVWFQNARAKEKRTRSLGCNTVEGEQTELSGAGERDRA